ncbi:MAG: aminoacyl-tRNA hydrolase [Rhodothalassiaceae bacterium]
MRLLVGLGNPGARYAGNRHNIGFMAADAIARHHGFSPSRARFQGETMEGMLDGVKCLLLKPQTYMNESGRAVAEAARFFRTAPADIIVFHDELDLAPGRIRVKTGGGHAGHNGLRSIIAHIGEDFVRVRMGIGHPGDRDLVTPYVLSDFSKEERSWLDPLLEALARAAPMLIAGDPARFMTELARLGAAKES